MFSYYGSKSKLAHLYPKPVHSTIIEPFAGSARYSLLHWENDVHLYDVDPVVVGVWQYLLEASPTDILELPDVPSKVHLDSFGGLEKVERDLIGFHLCRGKARPRKVGHGQNSWGADKVRIARNLYKIKHWQVTLGSYHTIPNNDFATWFVDPPYKEAQERDGNTDRYTHWQVDYGHLGTWCRTRWGQLIVCEGAGADWLPFRLLVRSLANTNTATAKKSGEYIYTQP